MVTRRGFGADLSTTAASVQQGISLANNPDALYAAALHSLGNNPAAMVLLNPMTKTIFDQIYGQVKGLISSEISAVGDAIISGASGALTSILGASGSAAASAVFGAIGQAIGQVVSDVAPFLGMIAGNVVELAQMSSQFNAPSVAANQAITNRLLGRPVQGTGGGAGGFAVTPADIFAPASSGLPNDEAPWKGPDGKMNYPDPWTQRYFPVLFPYSTLGLCLAALTESDMGTDPVRSGHGPPYMPGDLQNLSHFRLDSTIRHNNVAWALMPYQYNSYIEQQAGTTSVKEPNVGIPYETRKTMQLLRLAMGSRASTKNGDPSALLYAMWADLLTNAWKSGQMTGGFAVFALAHLWGPDGWNDAGIVGPGKLVPGEDGPYGFVDAASAIQGASSEDWTPIVNQVISLVGTLGQAQAAVHASPKLLVPPALLKITLPPELVACAKAKGTWKNNTCTTTRQGVVWSKPKLAFVPKPLSPLLVVKKSSPLLPVLFGVAAVGSIAWMAKHRKTKARA